MSKTWLLSHEWHMEAELKCGKRWQVCEMCSMLTIAACGLWFWVEHPMKYMPITCLEHGWAWTSVYMQEDGENCQDEKKVHKWPKVQQCLSLNIRLWLLVRLRNMCISHTTQSDLLLWLLNACTYMQQQCVPGTYVPAWSYQWPGYMHSHWQIPTGSTYINWQTPS